MLQKCGRKSVIVNVQGVRKKIRTILLVVMSTKQNSEVYIFQVSKTISV